MAELERMVSQKVQSLHERVKAKEVTFRVRAPSHAPEAHCTSDVTRQSRPPVMLQRLAASPALLDSTVLCLCGAPPACGGACMPHSSSARSSMWPLAVR